MCVEILLYINQIENAVVSWEGGEMAAPEAVDSINASARAVMESGFSIVLRKGPEDQTAGLIGQVIAQTRMFSELGAPQAVYPRQLSNREVRRHWRSRLRSRRCGPTSTRY